MPSTLQLPLLCVCLTAFLAAPAFAGQRSVEDVIKDEMELMVKECKPTDDQQKTLKEKFKAKQDALEAWEKTNGDKLKAAQSAANAARKGTDADAKKKANEELRTLQTERELAAAEASKAVLAALTDAQKTAWAGAQLTSVTLAKYKKISLNEDQTAKIKSACAAAAKELGEFTGDDRKDKQARMEIQKRLKWAIDNVILTTEQRDVISPKPAEPAAPAAPEPATPKPDAAPKDAK